MIAEALAGILLLFAAPIIQAHKRKALEPVYRARELLMKGGE